MIAWQNIKKMPKLKQQRWIDTCWCIKCTNNYSNKEQNYIKYEMIEKYWKDHTKAKSKKWGGMKNTQNEAQIARDNNLQTTSKTKNIHLTLAHLDIRHLTLLKNQKNIEIENTTNVCPFFFVLFRCFLLFFFFSYFINMHIVLF